MAMWKFPGELPPADRGQGSSIDESVPRITLTGVWEYQATGVAKGGGTWQHVPPPQGTDHPEKMITVPPYVFTS